MSRYGESFRIIVKHPCVPMHDFTCDQVGLKFLQLLVGDGLIEAVRVAELGAAGIDLFVNEDGIANKLPPNIVLPDGRTLVGPIVFIGYNADTGDSLSLTANQAGLIDSWLNNCRHAQALL